MSKRGSRNNLLAGLFVLVSVALATFIIILIANIGETFQATKSYIVRFSLTEGAFGLAPGSAVMLGGQRVGRVSTIEFSGERAPQAPSAVDVHIKIRADLALFHDADVYLVQPLLGTNTQINIVSVGGEPGGATTPLLVSEDEVIDGALAPPVFLAQAGFGKSQKENVQNILANFDRTSAWVADDLRDEIMQTKQRIDEVMQRIDRITVQFESAWPTWSDKTTSILTKVDDRVAPLFDEGSAGMADARRAIAKVEGVIDENRDGIRSTVSSLESISERFDGTLYREVEQAVQTAIRALEEIADTAQSTNDLIRRNTPQLETTIANARLASDQLKATAVEVRAAPWRLLYQPGRKEFENELLYDTVRTYSAAVSNLRATAETLRAVQADDGKTQAGDGRTIEELVVDLQQAFDDYQLAERKFLEQWLTAD